VTSDRHVRRVNGIAAAGGIGVGPVFLLDPPVIVPVRRVGAGDVGQELARFDDARRLANSEMASAQEAMRVSGERDVAEMTAMHRLLLDDPTLLLKVRRLIQLDRLSAESAVREGLSALASQFLDIPDAYIRERGTDVEAVAESLIRILLAVEKQPIGDMARGSIVVAHRFSPADPLLLARAGAAGLVSDQGGASSHAAIIAKANDLPYVAGVAGLMELCRPGERIIVDALAGEVIVDPDAAAVEEYERRAEAYRDRRRALLTTARTPCVMTDGTRVRMTANIELLEEIPRVIECGADAVGLFRTEFLYLDRTDLPSEEEEYQDAVTTIRGLGGRLVTFRTLDLGGDKLPLGLRIAPGPNPALGVRGIRLMSTLGDVLRRQLRALYRASVHGPLRIMFPLISDIDEFMRARALCDEVKNELVHEGAKLGAPIPIGAMVETPSAALMADRLVARADFLSLGTNDLVQYTLAADRENTDVAHLYRPQSPAVLRLLEIAADAACAVGKPISVCGDMASDPRLAVVLVGLGIRELSVAPSELPAVKMALTKLSSRDAEQLAARALSLDTADEVQRLLDDVLPAAGEC
jgi:phosphotransferase system enzyme I (PtsI)